MKLAISLCVGILSCHPVTTFAGPYEPPSNLGDLTVSPISRIGDMRPQVINGEAVTAARFPAVMYAAFHDQAAKPSCTAVLIGRRIILTAAHCVGHNKSLHLMVGARKYSGQCKHHPKYIRGIGDHSADLAICRLTQAVHGIDPEHVATEPSEPAHKRPIVFAGYGCTSTDFTRGQSGKFNIGFALVDQVAGGGGNAPHYFTTNAALADSARAILCPGDSGGPAFCLADNKSINGSRAICGINSRVECLEEDSSRRCVKVGNISFVASIGKAISWIREAAVDPICEPGTPIAAQCRKAQ